jgi:hypothetical protein
MDAADEILENLEMALRARERSRQEKAIIDEVA